MSYCGYCGRLKFFMGAPFGECDSVCDDKTVKNAPPKHCKKCGRYIDTYWTGVILNEQCTKCNKKVQEKQDEAYQIEYDARQKRNKS